ncbi:GILT-like protein 1 [Bradysia coprophila]|uniref:GILT-like protein 1 n=1 Tax=Bradysia coprophila TaxID=38358 RepID=UPI00187DB6F0|nr:GILT-like protein 1 [Bradysia coprophila]
MKLFIALVFAIFVAVHAQDSSSSEERGQLQVGIYYNSLCSDTARFITDQLLPAYEHLSDFIDLFFIPFGKAYSVDHGEYFICQFGPAECYGNMLQLCGLHQICRNEQAQVDFIACEMRLPFNLNATRPECSELVGIEWDEVTHCINNGFARQLKLDAERRTHRVAYPYPDFVPTIVYNGEFDQELQDRSLVEFAKVICEQIDDVAPICAEIP